MRANSTVLFLLLAMLNSSTTKAEEEEKKESAHISFERDELDSSGHNLIAEESEEKKFRAFLRTAIGYNTNPFSVPNADVEGGGSFVFKMRPAFGFKADGEWARFDLGLAAEGQVVFGAEQDARVMLLNSNAFFKGELLPKSVVAIQVEGMVEETREVEDIFMDSLTQLISTFRAGAKFHLGPFSLRANGEVKNRTYFDVSQPVRGRFEDDPGAFNDQSYAVWARAAFKVTKNIEIFSDAKYGMWYGRDESEFVWNNPLWVNLGVSGMLAPNVKASLSGGYANAFIRLKSNNELLNGASFPFAASAELNWKINRCSEFYFKADRGLHSRSLFLDVYTSAIQMDYRHAFGEKFTFVFAPYFRVYEYGKPLNANHTALLEGNVRTDLLLGVREEVMYFAKPWLSVGLSHRGKYRWTNAADFQIADEAGQVADATGASPNAFTQNEFLLTGSLFY
jgi:hypothetical protein